MELKKVNYTIEDGVGVIQMNSPENLNAVDEQMADDLLSAIDAAEKDPAVKVIVLKGAGKAFSAGGDVGYFYDCVKAGGHIDHDALILKLGNIVDRLKKLSKLVVTSVHGAAAGAGISLSLCGDYMICADNAKLIMAFINLALVPDTGAAWLLNRSIGNARTFELAASGRPLRAEEAKELGLAHIVCPKEDLDRVTMEFAKKLTTGPLLAYQYLKKQLYDINYAGYKDFLMSTELPTQQICNNSDDFKEACAAFVEKRPPVFHGK